MRGPVMARLAAGLRLDWLAGVLMGQVAHDGAQARKGEGWELASCRFAAGDASGGKTRACASEPA